MDGYAMKPTEELYRGGRLTERPAWSALRAHYSATRQRQLRELFAREPERGERFALEAAGIYLDYSKNLVTEETLGLLVQLAEAHDSSTNALIRRIVAAGVHQSPGRR
jgi:hypothetical protein